MIAQALLSLLLCGVLIYGWAEYRRSPVVTLLSVAASLAGLYFVWMPSHSTWLAEFVGVGRGADLILYIWVCISLMVVLNLHLKLRAQQEIITKLARTIAITNVVTPSPPARLGVMAEKPRKEGLSAASDVRRSTQMGDQIA